MTPTQKAHLSAILAVVVAVVGQVVALGLISGDALHLVQVGLAGLTAVAASYLGVTLPNNAQ